MPASAPAVARALDPAEFASLLGPLGPWDAGRRVAVAVSGGADSLCLALLAHGWGDATAFIVDHGLRCESASEASWVAAVLQAKGMPARIITLTQLRHGPGLAARARAARYTALAAACREAGLVDLLLGHHAADQAETVLMRRRSGSGPSGLAGMAAVAERRSIRLVRPLLAIAPERLRQTLRERAQGWVEDPSNADPQATRTRLRAELAGCPAPESGHRQARARADAEAAAAAELARRAMIHPAGFAVMSPGPIGSLALGMLVRALGGRTHLPPADASASLAAEPRPATLAGVRLLPAGRLGPGWLLVREAAALAPAVPLVDGAVWDGRFRAVGVANADCTLGAVGLDAARLRGISPWSAVVLATLPAIRRNNVLSAVPHLAYGPDAASLGHVRLRHAGLPVGGAPFVVF